MVPLEVTDLLERNRRYATSNHQPIPYFVDLKSLPNIVVVTCIDPRLVPEQFLGLNVGDAAVCRNAGGRTPRAMKDVLTFDTIAPLADIVVVHHTDCAATHYKNVDIERLLKSRGPAHEVDAMGDFGQIDDLEQSLKDDVAFLKNSPFLRSELKGKIHGFLYDIKTGELKKVAT